MLPARGLSLIVFPEGTRSRDGRVATFKAGSFFPAVQTGIPIVRVANEEEALGFTNQSRLGLIHYVFTRDKLRGRRIALYEHYCRDSVHASIGNSECYAYAY